MKRITFFLTILLCSSSVLIAQTKTIKKANTLYDNKRYADAIPLLEKILTTESNIALRTKLANSYRLTNQSSKAEELYSQIVLDDKAKDITYLNYGEVLIINGKYDAAKDWIATYLATNPSDETALQLLQSCDAVRNIKPYFEDITIRSFPYNTPNDENCPILLDDRILFASDKPSSGLFSRKSGWTGRDFIRIYQSKCNKPGNTYAKPTSFAAANAYNKNVGGISISPDKTEIVFARNNTEMSKNNAFNLQLYSAEAKKSGGKFRKVKKISFCSKEHNYMHPALSPDGRYLYFATDKAGGEGGLDICVSERDADGDWAKPINLGKAINTNANEAFPFVGEDGKIFFSSKGWGGLGGFDVFVSEPDSNGNWGQPINLGTPINSSYDDFSFYMLPQEPKGMFASSRHDSNDNIFFFEQQTIQNNFEVTPKTYEQPLPETTIIEPEVDKKTPINNPAITTDTNIKIKAITTPDNTPATSSEDDFIVKEKKKDDE